MPELKPLPCPNPKCGSVDKFCMNHVVLTDEYCITCKWGVQGPHAETPAAAIAEFNALPRSLRWTHEPPNVAGWYWYSMGKGHAVCLLVCADGKAKLGKDHFTDAELLGGEWAGPIAPPIEP